MSTYLHFTSRKIIDKKNRHTKIQNYTIARYEYTGKSWEDKITNKNNIYIYIKKKIVD